MLGKLIRHEFRATGRIMLPLLGAELLLAFLAGLSMRGLDRVQDTGFLSVFYVMTITVFFLGLFALGVVAVVLMIQRFYRNLLRDEGYLSMTLPVSVDEHIWAKLFTSCVWFAAVALLSAASLLVVLRLGAKLALPDVLDIRFVIQSMGEELDLVAGQIPLLVLEVALLSLLGACAICLRCYMAMAIGCSAAEHKLLLSFVAYIAIGFVLSLVQNTTIFGFLPRMEMFYSVHFHSAAELLRFYHATMGFSALVLLTYDLVFYFVTRYFLKNKLNLS